MKGADYPGMFEAVGRGGQRINVWPAKDLVLVFTGGEFEPGDLAKFILKAIQSDQRLPVNPQTVANLKVQLMAATEPPPAQDAPKLPAAAALISGKKMKMSANGLDLRELTLRFDQPVEASAELLVDGHHEHLKIGLDGVSRLSPNSLVNLPTASTGGWKSGDTFVLQMNLVGGINFYEITLTFSSDAREVTVDLNERTGLNKERFTGVLSN